MNTYLLTQMTSHPRTQLQCKYVAVSNCVFLTESRKIGRVMAQEGRRRLPTAETRVRTYDSICGICVGQSGAGRVFWYSNSGFPCQYDFTSAPYYLVKTFVCAFRCPACAVKPRQINKQTTHR